MYGYLTTFGNEFKKLYIPNTNNIHNNYIPLSAEERERENKRLRSVKTKSNIIQRVLSTSNLKYFGTLTSDLLCHEPIVLLQKAAEFLKEERNNCDDDYYSQLEAFYNENRGFHIHFLSSFPVNLDKWNELYNANKESDENIILNEMDENYLEIFRKINHENNLYCEPLKHLDSDEFTTEEAINIGLSYITKKINITKERLEKLYPNKRFILYRSNIKKINKNTIELDEEELLELLKQNSHNLNIINRNTDNNKAIKIDFIDKNKDFYAINFKIKKNQIDFNNIDKGFIDNKILKTIPYVAYKTYKINNLEEEITFYKFRIEEIFDLIEGILKIDKDFDIDCYLETIISFKDIICSLQRQIIILANANLPNSDGFCSVYGLNSSMEKGSVKTPYHVAHSLWLYGWANRPVNKKSVLSKEKSNSHTKERGFFNAKFEKIPIFSTFLLKFLGYIRHIPGEN